MGDLGTSLNTCHDLKRPPANYLKASNFTFGLIIISEVSEISVLLAQIKLLLSLYSTIFELLI